MRLNLYYLLMLDVNNVTFNTLPNRKDEEIYFDECSQLRSTIEKNRKKVKILNQNERALVPKKSV